MICAESFGCSGKAPFGETRLFAGIAGLSGLGDYSRLAGSNLIFSVDRISRCSSSWKEFAEIAFAHASRDLEVGFGLPVHALVCFEFGEDTQPEDRTELVRSVYDAASSRNIELGKCHSAKTLSDVTSLVIALVGEGSLRPAKPSSRGMVWISGQIGFSKLLYLEGMKQKPNQHPIAKILAKPLNLRRFHEQFSVLSDVSGHALAGCLCDLAERETVAIEVKLSARLAASPDVLEVPVSLLENSLDDYSCSRLAISNPALRLSLLKETAGPIVAFSAELAECESEELESFGWQNIGSFERATASVSIGWVE